MQASPPTEPVRQPRLVTLLALVGLAVALRLFAWSRTLMMMNDGVDFLWQAERFLEGDFAAALSHPYHPLYGAFAALASLVTGDLVLGGLAVSIASGVLAVVASWGIARCLLPTVTAAPAAAALVAATCTRVLHVTSDIQSDGLFAGLCLMALWATVAATEAGGCRWRLAAAGLFTGLAYLTRPEGLYLVVPVGLWVAGALARPTLLVSRLGRSLVFGVGLLALVVPYVATLHSLTGVWGLSLKPSLQVAGLREGDEVHLAPPGSPLAHGFIARSQAWRQAHGRAAHGEPPARAKTSAPEVEPPPDPTEPAPVKKGTSLSAPLANWVLGVARNSGWDRAATGTLRQFVSTVRLELWLLVIPGVVMLFRRRRRLAVGMCLSVVGWLAVSAAQMHINGYVTNRHLIVAVTMLLPVAGLGLLGFWARGPVLKVLAVLALLEAAEAGTRPRRPDNGPRLEALAWVSENTHPDHFFMTHRRRDGYYAERAAIPTRMPCNEGQLARRIERDAVPYLVYDLDKLEEHHADWMERGVVQEVVRFEGEGDTVLVLAPRFGDRAR